MDHFVDQIASLDFPSFLLGNFAHARPAVLSGTQDVFEAVEVGGLVSTLLLGSFFAFLEG